MKTRIGKTSCITIMLLGCIVGLGAQVHVPFSHNWNHTENSNCRAYAMGRAY